MCPFTCHEPQAIASMSTYWCLSFKQDSIVWKIVRVLGAIALSQSDSDDIGRWSWVQHLLHLLLWSQTSPITNTSHAHDGRLLGCAARQYPPSVIDRVEHVSAIMRLRRLS